MERRDNKTNTEELRLVPLYSSRLFLAVFTINTSNAVPVETPTLLRSKNARRMYLEQQESHGCV